MRTRTTDRRRSAPEHPPIARSAPPSYLDDVAFWLEDDIGNRVSKFFSSNEKPLRLAGRVLENVGSLDGWAIVRQDTSGARHVVASGTGLERIATPFMPKRAPGEASQVRRFIEARRRVAGFPSRARIETDEKVY